MNYLEIFNEIAIMIMVYHLFFLSDYYPYPDNQYLVGWSALGICALTISVNLALIILDTLKILCAYLRKFINYFTSSIKSKTPAKS